MANKINCPDVKWFRLLAAGRLTSEQEKKLERHLEKCETCQRHVDELNDLSQFETDTAHRVSNIVNMDSKNLQNRLNVIKSEEPTELAKVNNYLDVQPWLQSSSRGVDQIAEFEIIDFVGRGGMGVVFKCLDTKLERTVALKLMSPQMLAEDSASERFLREARSAAKINHPHVVTVHAVNEVRGLPYLVMEFIEGHSLENRIQSGQAMTFSEVSRIAQQVLAGLAEAHEQGVLHRDIKPANIMLDSKTDNAKIADFGLACSMEGSKLTRTGLLIGTPEFLSPEQAMGLETDERSDLFSVGCVLYALCCGSSPFSGTSVMATLDNVRSLSPKPIANLNRSVPGWFARLVEELLTKEKELRVPSASAALDHFQLHSTVQRETALQIDLSTTQKILQHKQERQNKFLHALSIFTLALCLLISTVFWWFYSRQTIDKNPTENTTSTNKDFEDHNDLPGLSPDSDNVFTVNNFDELLEVVELPQANINIILPSDAWIGIDDCVEISNKNVTISTWGQTPAALAIQTFEKPAFVVDQGSLKLSNVSISDLVEEDANEDENRDTDDFASMIVCQSAAFELSDSTVDCHQNRFCVDLEKSDAQVSGSRLLGSERAILSVSDANNTYFEFENSLFIAPVAIQTDDGSQLRFNIDKCTFLSEYLINASVGTPRSKLFDLKCADSVFLSTEAMVCVSELENTNTIKTTILSNLFRFTGQGNLLPPAWLFVDDEEHELELLLSDVFPALPGLGNQPIAPALLQITEFDEILEQISDGEFGFADRLEAYGEVGAKIELWEKRFRSD